MERHASVVRSSKAWGAQVDGGDCNRQHRLPVTLTALHLGTGVLKRMAAAACRSNAGADQFEAIQREVLSRGLPLATFGQLAAVEVTTAPPGPFGWPHGWLLVPSFIVEDHDMLHKQKNGETRLWSRQPQLFVQIPGMQLPKRGAKKQSAAAGISMKGFVLKVSRLLARIDQLQPALCKASVVLGTPRPLVVAGEVSHRFLIITNLASYLLQQRPNYEHAALQFNQALGGNSWKATVQKSEDKLQHLREVYLGLHSPMFLVLASLAAELHPYCCDMYTLLNLNDGFVKANTRTWLLKFLAVLQHIADNPVDVLYKYMDVAAVKSSRMQPTKA
eukprot:gene1377-1718_t